MIFKKKNIQKMKLAEGLLLRADLKKKIEHIVENKEEANKVRIRGMELVVDHSYTNRVKNLLKELAD